LIISTENVTIITGFLHKKITRNINNISKAKSKTTLFVEELFLDLL